MTRQATRAARIRQAAHDTRNCLLPNGEQSEFAQQSRRSEEFEILRRRALRRALPASSHGTARLVVDLTPIETRNCTALCRSEHAPTQDQRGRCHTARH